MNKRNVPVYTLKKMMQLVRMGFDVLHEVLKGQWKSSASVDNQV